MRGLISALICGLVSGLARGHHTAELDTKDLPHPGCEPVFGYELGLTILVGPGFVRDNFSRTFAARQADRVVRYAGQWFEEFVGISLVIDQVVFLDNEVPCDSINKALDVASDYRETTSPHRHLFTSCSFSGANGVAYMGKLCHERYSAGVSAWPTGRRSMEAFAKTFAHELAHNLGASHSFGHGQRDTGGIMDYGDGSLFDADGKPIRVGFRYPRQVEMCQILVEKKPCLREPERDVCGDGVVDGSEECECVRKGATKCGNCVNCKLAQIECDAGVLFTVANNVDPSCCHKGRLLGSDTSCGPDNMGYCAIGGECVPKCPGYAKPCGTGSANGGCRQRCSRADGFCSPWFPESRVPDGTRCANEGVCAAGTCLGTSKPTLSPTNPPAQCKQISSHDACCSAGCTPAKRFFNRKKTVSCMPTKWVKRKRSRRRKAGVCE